MTGIRDRIGRAAARPWILWVLVLLILAGCTMPAVGPVMPSPLASSSKSTKVTPDDLLLVDQMILNGKFEDVQEYLRQFDQDDEQIKARMSQVMGYQAYAEGRSLLTQGLFEKAISKLEEALQYLPGDTGVLRALDAANLGLGKYYLGSLNAAEAIQALAKVTHDPSFQQQADALIKVDVPAVEITQRGYTALQAGDYQVALLAFQQALKLKPDLQQALDGRRKAEEMIALHPTPSSPSPSPSPSFSPSPTASPSPSPSPSVSPTPSPSPTPTSTPTHQTPTETPTSRTGENPAMRSMGYPQGEDWTDEKVFKEIPGMRSMDYSFSQGWIDAGTTAQTATIPQTAQLPPTETMVSVGNAMKPESLAEENAALHIITVSPPSLEGVRLVGSCYQVSRTDVGQESPALVVLPLLGNAGADVLQWDGSAWRLISSVPYPSDSVATSVGGSALLAVGTLADTTLPFWVSSNGYAFPNLDLPESPHGICAGMAATIAWSVYPDEPPPAAQWSDLPASWQQWILDVQSALFKDGSAQSIDLLSGLNHLQTGLRSGKPVFLNLTDAQGIAGDRSLVAYRLQPDLTLPGYRMSVYDPNDPGQEDRQVVLRKDLKDGGWSMEGYDGAFQNFRVVEPKEIGQPPEGTGALAWITGGEQNHPPVTGRVSELSHMNLATTACVVVSYGLTADERFG